VGDLFHSRLNKELDLFKKWRAAFPDLAIHLIKGNHDILEEKWYETAGIFVSQPRLDKHYFHFVHDINDGANDFAHQENKPGSGSPYYITGHIHPGIRISGTGKQSLCFPCFYFGQHFAVLPAFSRFTGVALIDPARSENVFAIVEDEVMQIQ